MVGKGDPQVGRPCRILLLSVRVRPVSQEHAKEFQFFTDNINKMTGFLFGEYKIWRGIMKKMLCMLIAVCALSGCVTSVLVDDNTHRKVFKACECDTLCVRDVYSVAWDNGCRYNCRDYPVTYRAQQTEFVMVPETANNCNGNCGGVR